VLLNNEADRTSDRFSLLHFMFLLYKYYVLYYRGFLVWWSWQGKQC